MSSETRPSISVVIACHTLDRWDLLNSAIASVREQNFPAAEIIVVVDHNRSLASELRTRINSAGRAKSPDVVIIENTNARGASGARNTGAFRARSEFVAFLDDDAAADPDWLLELVAAFVDDLVVGVGGRVLPAWSERRPTWFPPSFDWVVGASFEGMPTVPTPVRNVWAENMAVRRSVFEQVGGFRDGFGKLGSRSRPEDTELCIRMAAARPGGRWMYEPAALVRHHVPAARASYPFFLARGFHEGRGKAELARLLPAPTTALSSERDYVRRVLPGAVRSHLRAAASARRIGPALQAATIVVGLSATVLGFGVDTVAARIGRKTRRTGV